MTSNFPYNFDQLSQTLEPRTIFSREKIITASEAIHRLRSHTPSKKNDGRPADLIGLETGNGSTESPRVVFFPTGDSQGAEAAKCQDHAAQGNQFNIFAFLAFMLSVFNAVRYIFDFFAVVCGSSWSCVTFISPINLLVECSSFKESD